MTTTPNEFLQFAHGMRLEHEQSLLHASAGTVDGNPANGYSLTGLAVLNNLCHLIEQIHTLKAENGRLRAHLDLMNHVEGFLLKSEANNRMARERDTKYLRSATSLLIGSGACDEEKSFTLSPTNSLRIKKRDSPTLSMLSRDRSGIDLSNHHDDSTSMLHADHEPSDLGDGPPGATSWNNWNKIRRALSFSRRRKQRSPTSPVLQHTDRTIPAISISFESDDDRLSDRKHRSTHKRIRTANSSRRDLHNDESEEDELPDFKRKPLAHREQSRLTTSYLPAHSGAHDDDGPLTRKQSKIAHYRHKLYSKLHTVKKQFSEQNLSVRPLTHASSATFDELGSGFNQALLSTKLASAMTKSYQQKMREWQSLQKSNFLVNYRRQSVINKNDLIITSRKASDTSIANEPTHGTSVPLIAVSDVEMETSMLPLSPILSPNQRSLILHQWREIMSEEIALRHCNEYLARKMQDLKQLESNLKALKTNIFCTTNGKYIFTRRSMPSIEQLDQDILVQNGQTSLRQRCRSLQTLVDMPASWILAVQSAAYSDILDGTSRRATERAIIFNKKFFNQLKHFKDERYQFQQETIRDTTSFRYSKATYSSDESSNSKRPARPRTKVILARACLRKFSYTSTNEFPQSFLANAMIPLQTTISKLEASSSIDLLSSAATIDPDTNFSSSATLSKRSKRARFDLKKTLQRSKSICMTQFNSWLQRRRQQHLSEPRRKSAIDPKPNKDTKSSPSSTPKFFSSPRLARIHQRIFKPHPSSPSPLESPLLDDSDEQFHKLEHPVRIYLPGRASPSTRHVRITDTTSANNSPPTLAKITSPISARRQVPSALKSTARERRESFAAQSKSS